MRFRFVLPVLSIILAVILFRVGDMQIEKILDGRRPDRGSEPVPDSYARAKYFDYALNAPAWATLEEERGMLWSKSTLWGGNLKIFRRCRCDVVLAWAPSRQETWCEEN
jgi:hypothetical protein